jgi:DNA invertase Pin-like site-specific DNA recombinase
MQPAATEPKSYIYCRVSTDGQTTDNQALTLKAKYPGAEVVCEIASGAKQRPMLAALVQNLKGGDTIIVAALDRLGRKTTDVLLMIEDLQKRGVNLLSERERIDFSTPIGRLVTEILVSVSQIERALISERTKAGLAAAREKGNTGGRPRRITEAQVEQARELLKTGLSLRKVAEQVGCSDTRLGQLLAECHQSRTLMGHAT